MSRAEELIRSFSLLPHPEGGHFSEVYASTAVSAEDDTRPCAGSIYFLLQGADISHFHQIDCEELWFIHEGCGLKVHVVEPDGRYHVQLLGLHPEQGESPMVFVRAGAIFAAENLRKDSYTFLSCATAPQFRYSGFRLVPREELNREDIPAELFL